MLADTVWPGLWLKVVKCSISRVLVLLILLSFSCWVVSDSLQPHGLQHARLPCPSPSPRVCSNSCPLSRWCHPAISSSVILFSCLQSFPASGSLLIYFLNCCLNSFQFGPVFFLQVLDWNLGWPFQFIHSQVNLNDVRNSNLSLDFWATFKEKDHINMIIGAHPVVMANGSETWRLRRSI